MNKMVLYVFTALLFLTACSPYGLTGGPDSDSNSDDSEFTPEEKEAMENMKVFPITLEQFEKNMSKQKKETELDETETGFTTNKGMIEVDYKGEDSTQDEQLTNIFVILYYPGVDFDVIEEESIKLVELLFESLEVSYDMEELIKNIKANKGEEIITKDTIIEVTNFNENIQLIITPN